MDKHDIRGKLVAGMLAPGEKLFKEAGAALEKEYGPVDYVSESIPFVFTNYYEKEIGPGLIRRFVSFKRHIEQSALPGIKCCTMRIEKFFSTPAGRRINIDPGYVTGAKLVLATTKDYDHRIYLSSGIFAEVTLRFRDGSFRPWEWTYPDYRSDAYIEIFNRIRSIYMREDGMKKTGEGRL